MTAKRTRVFVDRKVQGALVVRVVLYWVVCLWGTFCVLAGFPIAVTLWLGFDNGPTAGQLVYRTWLDFWPILAASALVLPVIVWDVLRVSHRFAGPIIRLQRAMRNLAEGKPVRPVEFREHDFWGGLASEFNRLAECLQETRAAAASLDHEESQEEELVEAI